MEIEELHLRKRLEKGFKKQGPKKEKALFLLEELFQELFQASLKDFLEKYHPNNYQKILTALLYGIYFKDISLTSYVPQDFPYFFFQLLAENSSLKKRKECLKTLSLEEKLKLIAFCYTHYREGSYFLLTLLEEEKELSFLLASLRRDYFNKRVYSELVKKNLSLKEIVRELEIFSLKETQKIHALFYQTLPLMGVTAPLYSEEDFHTFFKFFGLEGIFSHFEFEGKICTEGTLKEKMEILYELFRRPSFKDTLRKEEVLNFYSFIYSFISHLHAYLKEPSLYFQGFSLLCIAMATKGKLLKEEVALNSLLKSMKTLFIHSASFQKTPIYIFDQSAPPLFKKNNLFIKQLNRKYQSDLRHLSFEESLSLGKKIGISEESFFTGYGGARNMLFFLTPCTAEESLFIFDDDVTLSESNLFAHALFALTHKDKYGMSTGLTIGRTTKNSIQFIPLEKIQKEPESLFQWTSWSNTPQLAALSETVTKKRFCLNVPMGGEEGHQHLFRFNNFFLKPSLHLCGARHPKGPLPSDPLSHLDPYLLRYFSYSLSLHLFHSLIDSFNREKRCALPWNKKEIYPYFSSFDEVISFVLKENIKKETQKRFWENFVTLFTSSSNISSSKDSFTSHIHYLKALSLKKGAFAFFSQDAATLWLFALSLLKEDLQILELLPSKIENLRKKIEKETSLSFKDLPTTYNLYLLCKSVGCGEFFSFLKQYREFATC